MSLKLKVFPSISRWFAWHSTTGRAKYWRNPISCTTIGSKDHLRKNFRTMLEMVTSCQFDNILRIVPNCYHSSALFCLTLISSDQEYRVIIIYSIKLLSKTRRSSNKLAEGHCPIHYAYILETNQSIVFVVIKYWVFEGQAAASEQHLRQG